MSRESEALAAQFAAAGIKPADFDLAYQEIQAELRAKREAEEKEAAEAQERARILAEDPLRFKREEAAALVAAREAAEEKRQIAETLFVERGRGQLPENFDVSTMSNERLFGAVFGEGDFAPVEDTLAANEARLQEIRVRKLQEKFDPAPPKRSKDEQDILDAQVAAGLIKPEEAQ